MPSTSHEPLRARGWRPGAVAEPPECPPGWKPGPPDFVGIGAQRAGTSWWHHLLAAHPQVAAAPGMHKEVHFFDSLCDGSFTPDDVARYHSYFPRPDRQLAGEWTPRYMYDAWTPRLLAACAPEARLLVVLRDPLERYRSHLKSVIPMNDKAVFNATVLGQALARSLYYDQLRRVLRHFSREQLLVLQLERCAEEPAGELRRTYEFLRLEPDFVPEQLSEPVNPSIADHELPAWLVQEIVPTFEDEASRLAELDLGLDFELWPSIRDAAKAA